MMYKSQLWKIDRYDLFCGPGSHIITIKNNYFLLQCILWCTLFLWCKAEFSAAITPVLSVTEIIWIC